MKTQKRHPEVAPLEQVMRFEYAPFISKLENQGFATAAAEEAFQDLKRFLWLCAKHPEKAFEPPARIDRLWHVFLQFTHAYAEFCEKLLGRFIHHFPIEALSDSYGAPCNSCSHCSTGSSRTLDLASERSPIESTLKTALSEFGDLSENWKVDVDLKGARSPELKL